MAINIETPSRIWRRIQEVEAHEDDMPSLPSLPGFDESGLVPDKSLSMSVNQTPNRTVTAARNTSLQRSSNSSRKEDVPPMSLRTSLGARKVETGDVETRNIGLEVESLDISLPPHPMFSDNDIDIASFDASENSPSVGTLSRSRQIPGSEDDDEISLTEALASVSRTPSPEPPEPQVERDDLDNVSEQLTESVLGASMAKNVAIRRYRSPQKVPELSHSASSLSSSTTSNSSRERAVKSNDKTPVSFSASRSENRSNTSRSSEVASPVGQDSAVNSDEDVREPTFSSEDATSNITEVPKDRTVRFATESDAASLMLTPTNIPRNTQHETPAFSTLEFELNDLHTPLPRKKSFLLNVVNSSARPRLSFGTPHPRDQLRMESLVDAGSTPGPSATSTVLRAAGRRRLSHPLSQVHTFQTPSSGSSTGVRDSESTPSGANASYVSTASSHDLTLHHRANASFDPVTGSQGVGRFNQTKLNTYLNGLNRQLTKENQVLREHAAMVEEELNAIRNKMQHRGDLSSVAEEAGEQWLADKEELERELNTLKADLEAREKELDGERNGRKRDKEIWKDRMAEVEEGVGGIVRNLEKKLEASQQHAQTTESKLSQAIMENELLRSRVEQAERLLEANKDDIDPELRKITDERDELRRDIASIEARLQEKEGEATSLMDQVGQLNSDWSSSKSECQDLRVRLQKAEQDKKSSFLEIEELENENLSIKEEIRSLQTHILDLKTEKEAEVKRYEKQMSDLEKQLAQNAEELENANDQVAISADELDRAKDEVRQLESALEECERKAEEDDQELAQLRAKMASYDHEKSMALDLSRVTGKSSISDDEQYEALRQELDAANMEIGRLNALLQQSPARKAIGKAKDTRIELLEKQNRELVDELRATRDKQFTPRRNASMSAFSPMHRHLINLSMRTPKTPGEPLRDVSWLMNTTGNISTEQLLAEIGRLQEELDFANESVDDKLDKLEEAGFGVIDLTRALAEARKRIEMLEEQLRSSEERHEDQNETSKIRDSNHLLSESSADLRHRLTSITEELESLRKQREKEIVVSSDEKAFLQDMTNRLTAEIQKAKEDVRIAVERGMKSDRERAEQQLELAKARRAISDLEHQLQNERTRLKAMDTEISQAAKEKDEVYRKLRDTEKKMEDARDHLLQLKESNIKLESDLRLGQRVEEELTRNLQLIEELRRERSTLSDMHLDLQQQLATTTKTVNDLSTKHNQLQRSYNGRRKQLSSKSKEVDDLRAALTNQSAQLIKLRKEKERIVAENKDVQNHIINLETDLERIQKEAEAFGNDLKHLSAEKEMIETRYQREIGQHERVNKQNRAQIRILKEQLGKIPTKMSDQAVNVDKQMNALKLRHKDECKGLIVQIRYLKAKFTRENNMRVHLSHQKEYLLVLLSHYEKSEKKILATIAQAGFPQPSSPRKPKSLRAAALTVLFVLRASRSSEYWREQRSNRSAILAAYNNVRQPKNGKK